MSYGTGGCSIFTILLSALDSDDHLATLRTLIAMLLQLPPFFLLDLLIGFSYPKPPILWIAGRIELSQTKAYMLTMILYTASVFASIFAIFPYSIVEQAGLSSVDRPICFIACFCSGLRFPGAWSFEIQLVKYCGSVIPSAI